MNRSIILLIIILIINSISVRSQEKFNDSSDVYDHLAKKGIIKITYAYMQDYANKGVLSNIEEDGLKNFKKKYVDTSNEIDFNELSRFLNENKWSKTNNRILQKLIERYKNKHKLNKDFFNLIGIDKSYTHWNQKVDEILKSYNNELVNLNKKKSKKEASSNSQNKLVNQTNTSGNYSFTPLYLILTFIAGLIFGSLLIFYISERNIKSILKDKYRDYCKAAEKKYSFNYLNAVNYLQERKLIYGKKRDDIKYTKNKEIEKLKKEIAEHKEKKQNQDKQKENTVQNYKETPDVTPKKNYNERPLAPKQATKEETVFKSLFFTIPEEDGSFYRFNGEEINDGRKYYKILFNAQSSSGDIYYVSGQRDERAINRLDTNLKPVCDIENIAYASSSSRVEFIEKGKVILQGDKWVIDPDNKVKIRLV